MGNILFPWSSFFDDAEANYFGLGDILQDTKEALRLYNQAARLGSLVAYEKIGRIHEVGDGTAVNKEKALNYYKEGAKKGNFYCYWRMGVFFQGEKNYVNSDKCFSLFIKNRGNEFSDGQHLLLMKSTEINFDCCALLICKFCDNYKIPESLNKVIFEIKSKVIMAAKKMSKRHLEANNYELSSNYQLVVSYLENIS